MLIGITGRGGSGKSTLSKNIISKNSSFIHLEVDILIETKIFTSNKLVDDVNRFFTDKEYTLNDVILSYFDKSEKGKQIHKLFLNEVAAQVNLFISQNSDKNIIIDWFLLHEIFDLLSLDYKILTIASKKERIERASKREKTDNINMFINVDNNFVEVDHSKIDLVINTEKKYNYDLILNNINKFDESSDKSKVFIL